MNPNGVDQAPSSIIDLLVSENLIDPDQLRYATRAHAKIANPRPLIDVLVELGYVTQEQIREVISGHRLDIRIGDLLVELGHVRAADLQTALDLQREDSDSKKRLGSILIEHHFIDDCSLAQVLASQLGFSYCEPSLDQIDPEMLRSAPLAWFREHEFLPIREEGDHIIVAFADPLDPGAKDAAEAIFANRKVIGTIAPASAIRETLRTAEIRRPGLNQMEADSPAITHIVDQILAAALGETTSDIHIEAGHDRVRVRFRRSRSLVAFQEYPLQLGPLMAARFRELAEAQEPFPELAEGDTAAETPGIWTGRISHFRDEGQSEFRVSICPTVNGQRIHLRVLETPRLNLSEGAREAPSSLLRDVDHAALLDGPSGLIVIAGPRRSGRTTVLRGFLEYLKSPDTNVFCLEDPSELAIDGVSHGALRDFTESLPNPDALLAHWIDLDADVVALGDLRDPGSLSAALGLVETGAKVICICDSWSASSAIPALIRRGAEPGQLASVLAAIVSPRLLRRLCPDCSDPQKLGVSELRHLGRGRSREEATRWKFQRSRGCERCRNSGYHGLVPIFESLIPNRALRGVIASGANAMTLHESAVETCDLVGLFEHGLIAASEGQTDLAEVARELPRCGDPRPISELRRLRGRTSL